MQFTFQCSPWQFIDFRCEISDYVMVLIYKFAGDMPMNDTKKKLVSRY